MGRYKTIVADPPWDYPEGFALGPRPRNAGSQDYADRDCRLFSAEFVLVGTRGVPGRAETLPSAVIATTRSGGHSAKPEAWMDYFEAVSPPPRLEMFSRRARFGWETWGDQALHGGEAA